MARLSCNVCGGVYESDQGGVAYFHACPPLGVDARGRAVPRPGARNENLTIDPATGAAVPIAVGAGTTAAPPLPPPGPVVLPL